jgi:hypothetical protein
MIAELFVVTANTGQLILFLIYRGPACQVGYCKSKTSLLANVSVQAAIDYYLTVILSR